LINFGSDEQDYQTDVLALLAKQFIEESELNDKQPFLNLQKLILD